ncbi:putative lipooligosaccharide transport system, permease component (LptG family) [Campylobacter avium LMG 24591]|uniref:Putative lipooligosaccharide transport system, permease component (LptG family) n=1 Tax=Campylobacter avium LMG 24591 TaxID=522484 RepID=A0A222MV80_9BACT|nr:LptF/LptG family permease [Campylobacter avium]ASQ29795.1 putative lipooligosaccharide transport system, permease component (LptG family) [Campylobacter avium LMG 24591]OYD78894.1 putative lipooligosaccharide transport system, permease component (LptG family) [Campylobacter avium]
MKPTVFFRFITELYLKSFFIIFISLVAFFVGIDLLLNFNDLPKSANLILLYIMFLSFSAISYILPISLIFSMILAFVSILRTNELVSLFALGLSKKFIILYPFLWALFFCFLYVGLNFTSFAYADDYRSNIKSNSVLASTSSDVFVKYNDDFVYIQELNPNDNSVKNIRIFNMQDFNLSSLTKADRANFKDDAWILEKGLRLDFDNNIILFNDGFKSNDFNFSEELQGFKPKVIESATPKKSYSIIDAWQSFQTFNSQNINTNSIRTELYRLILLPFFAPFLMLILYSYFPLISRYFNLAFLSFIFFIVTLGVWGSLFLLTRLAENSVLLPEFAIIVPICLLALFSMILYAKQ